MDVDSSKSAAERGVGALLLVGHILVAHAPDGDDAVPVSFAQLAAQWVNAPDRLGRGRSGTGGGASRVPYARHQAALTT